MIKEGLRVRVRHGYPEGFKVREPHLKEKI